MYLVTGGAGFIGSHIVERLVARGEPVRVLDNFSFAAGDHFPACEGRVEEGLRQTVEYQRRKIAAGHNGQSHAGESIIEF